MPGWITRGGADALEDLAFGSGAALCHLDRIAAADVVPQTLWRARLALNAAAACVGFSGRRESAAQLRDALHLLRPGAHPGPAGEVFRHWIRAVARPISEESPGRAFPDVSAERIARWLDAGRGQGRGGTPVDRAAAVLEAVLSEAPRAETQALILGDATLALALGWSHLVPFLATGLKSRDLSRRGGDLRRACHRAVVVAAGPAARLAADLARGAGRLRAVAPKLRARGADRAVALFLTRDALAPVALTGIMSDRAARRLCERLVGLGALRELTGRDAFRLYGV